MYKKLIVLITLALLLVVPVTAIVYNTPASGTLYRGDSHHFNTPTEICSMWGLAPFSTTSWYRGYFQTVTSWPDDPYVPSYAPYVAISGPTGIDFDNVSVSIIPVHDASPNTGIPASFVEEAACAGGSFYPGDWYYYMNVTNPALNGSIIAEFSGTPTTGQAPTTVTFSDMSTGVNLLTWYWTFGDGTSAVLQQNPTHTFISPGTYQVNLTITNATLTNTTSKSGYITVTNGTADYTSTRVYATDGSTGAVIVGATLNLRDVENNSWVNATSTAQGTIITVLDGHTIDIYGSYPGTYTASQEIGASPGGNYYLPLMPPTIAAPVGFVNLYVKVFDVETNNFVQRATVNAKLPTGSEEGQNTGTTGIVLFLVPNNTVVILGAAASGYNSISQSTNSGTGAEKVVAMVLTKTTITVTTTAVPGSVVTNPATGQPLIDPITGNVITVSPTIDARSDAQKDTDLMGQLRDAGPSIIGLCIVAILFGLIKMIMKF